MQDNTTLDIVTDLPLDEVKRRLREVILEPGERQTQYHECFVGHIDPKGAKFTQQWSRRGSPYYELSFGALNGKTLLSLSNSVYQSRTLQSALLKAGVAPLSFVFLILGFVFYNGLLPLAFTTLFCSGLIVMCLLYKPKPLSKEEYLKDESVRSIMKTIKGQAL